MTPTELLQLHIDNDQEVYKNWQRAALTALATHSDVEVWTDDEFHKFWLAETIEEYYTQSIPAVAVLYMDLMTHAMSEIDFHSIAESVLETARESTS